MSVQNSSVRYIVYGQLFFVLNILICVALMPEGLAANGGASYYGNFPRTVWPYLIGLLGSSWLIFRGARLMPPDKLLKPIKYAAYCISGLLIVALASPYSTDLAWFHRRASIAIFLLQLFIATWIVLMIYWDGVNALLLSALGITIIITGLNLHPKSGFLIQGEMIFQLIFAALFYRGLTNYTSRLTRVI